MSSYALMTNVGRNKEAAALAGGVPLQIAEIAWGDGDHIPAGGETALVNEVGRKGVQGSGQVSEALNTAFFEILLDETEGPFIVREAGLFDIDGDLIAIAKYDPPVNKPKDTVSAALRINVVFSDLQNLVLQVHSADTYVPVDRAIVAGSGLTGGGALSADRTLGIDWASQQEAEAGLAEDKGMSPLRTAQTVAAALAQLTNGAPGALDTLNELAAALGDDPNFAATVTAGLADAMSGSNNLAEITDPAQARANIGAGTGVPLGAIAAFHQTAAPDGWLICDGTPVTALYPELRAHLLAQPDVQTDGNGDPLLPDFRGEFLRGLDAGRGVDVGRVLGAWQDHELAAHGHDLHVMERAIDGTDEEGDNTVSLTAPGQPGYVAPTGGSETRPRNVAALICIKAFDAVVPEGMADLSALLAGIATQVQAEEGVNNGSLMTSLRTAQAIAAQAPPALGHGQSWQDMAASRTADTVYQNTTGRSIAWSVQPANNQMAQVSADNVTWLTLFTADTDQDSGGRGGGTTIPPGHYYRVTGVSFVLWHELR